MNLILRAWLPKEKRMIQHKEVSIINGEVFERYCDEDGYIRNVLKQDAILMVSLGSQDKNEKFIFNGDVVRRNIPFGKSVSIVAIHGGSFKLECAEYLDGEFHSKGVLPMNTYTEWYEIMGNIYENPVLLMDYPELLEIE